MKCIIFATSFAWAWHRVWQHIYGGKCGNRKWENFYCAWTIFMAM